jgi:hypothetical protein
MNRRELIKAILPIVAIPVMAKGEEVGKKFKIKPDAKYVVFVNADKVDPEDFCRTPGSGLPEGTPVTPVYLASHESMDDVIRIYEVR